MRISKAKMISVPEPPRTYNGVRGTGAIMPPTVVVSRRGADRLRSGHPWIYRSDVLHSEAEPGDLVEVVSERERRFGFAFWSSSSQIALRFLSDQPILHESRLLRDRLRAPRTCGPTSCCEG